MNQIEQILGPMASKISANKYIKALSVGMSSIMPIMLGTSLIAILANLPIAPWTAFLKGAGLYMTAQDFISATLSLTGIYAVCTISYSLTKSQGKNPVIGMVMAMATFIALMPIKIQVGEQSVSALSTSNLGSSGIFVAMLCGLLVPTVYSFLSDKNLKIKVPDSVPPMVADSLEPTFVAIIIFTFVYLFKFAFTLTSYGDIFSAINTIVAAPIMKLGTSPWSRIVFYMFANLCWFFGIHPGPLQSCYVPVIYAAKTANIEAFMAGAALPYLDFFVIGMCIYMGGFGNTLGLCASTIFAKSEKYKSLRKLVVLPDIFNINEPVIFGFPVMLNPMYFIPLVFSPLTTGLITMLAMNIIPVTMNPTISIPWVTPGFINVFMQGGWGFLAVWVIAFIANTLIYLPFFIADDNRAYKEEQAQNQVETSNN